MTFGETLEAVIASFFEAQEARVHIRHARGRLNPKRNPVIDGHPPIPFHLRRHEITPCRGGFTIELDGRYQINATGSLHVRAQGWTTALHNALGAAFAPAQEVCFDAFKIDAAIEDAPGEHGVFERMGSSGPHFIDGRYNHTFRLQDEPFASRVLAFRHAFSHSLLTRDYDKLCAAYGSNTYLEDRKKSDLYYHIAHTLRGKVMLGELFRSRQDILDKRLHDTSVLSRLLLEEMSRTIITRCTQEQRLEKLALRLDEDIDVDAWPFLHPGQAADEAVLKAAHRSVQDATLKEDIDLWPYQRAQEFRKRLLARPRFDLREGVITFESIATRTLERDEDMTSAIVASSFGSDIAVLAKSHYQKLYERVNAVTVGVHVRVSFDLARSKPAGSAAQFFLRFPKRVFGHSSADARLMLDFYRFLADYNDSHDVDCLVAAADRPLSLLHSYLCIARDGTYPHMPQGYADLLDAIDARVAVGRTFIEREDGQHIDFVFDSPGSCARAVYHVLLRDDLATQYAHLVIFGR